MPPLINSSPLEEGEMARRKEKGDAPAGLKGPPDLTWIPVGMGLHLFGLVLSYPEIKKCNKSLL
jgi:hypothetical protein